MNQRDSLAVIVPVFNERETIAEVIQALLDARGEENWEIIAVDDGSNDGSQAILQSFADRIQVLRSPSTLGYGASLKTGLLATRRRNVMFFDADGQHDAADIPGLLEALETFEFVFGMRPRNAGVPTIRRPGKWVLGRVCNFLAAKQIPDINCGLRAGRREIYMRMLDLLPDGFSFSVTSLMYVLKSRFRATFIPVNCHDRKGTSHVRILHDGMKTVILALRLIMLFDPMRSLGYPAAVLITTGLVYQFYILVTTGMHVEGGSILSILAGFTLFLFALLGDQVASLRKEISSHHSLLLEERESHGRSTG